MRSIVRFFAMLEQLSAFTISAILLTLSPGPDIVYVLVQGMVNGKKAGFVTALGLVSGIIVHTSLVAFGVALLIQQSPRLFWGIKILGACYLFYLAYQTYRSDAKIDLTTPKLPKSHAVQLYSRGLIMNLINPKVIIFFLAFFPGFLWNPERQVVAQFYILGGIFLVQALIIFSMVAVLAGSVATFLRENKRVGIWFKWIQIVVFVGIGLFILG